MATDYEKFFLNSRSNVIYYECIEIAHPDFTETYRIVRNSTSGLSVQHEDPPNKYIYTYYPMKITSLGSLEDLDFGFTCSIGDLDGNLQRELDRINENDGFLTKPSFTLRGYRGDQLDTPLIGPFVLQVNEIAWNKDGAEFDATASLQNVRSSGRRYNIREWPQMKGLI